MLAPLLGFYLIDWIRMSSLAWWSLGVIAIASLMLVPEAKTLRRPADPLAPKPGGLH